MCQHHHQSHRHTPAQGGRLPWATSWERVPPQTLPTRLSYPVIFRPAHTAQGKKAAFKRGRRKWVLCPRSFITPAVAAESSELRSASFTVAIFHLSLSHHLLATFIRNFSDLPSTGHLAPCPLFICFGTGLCYGELWNGTWPGWGWDQWEKCVCPDPLVLSLFTRPTTQSSKHHNCRGGHFGVKAGKARVSQHIMKRPVTAVVQEWYNPPV